MKIPLSWLKKYTPVTITAEDLAHRLTMAGSEVSKITEIGNDWDSKAIVVGRIMKINRHPDADRLTLPDVDIGNNETVTVVCGAPNLATHQKIAFARQGALLFNPRSGKMERLKKIKIRGITSEGMICSPMELGLSEDHEGILVLGDDATVGMPLVDYLGDSILDIDVTPNRPDCLSVLGIAREAAALTGENVSEPDLTYPEKGPPIESETKIIIDDPDLCHRYTAGLIKGVKIGPSPQWIQDALIKTGHRPINNVVDITNYVMLEYGQPLHAFDFDSINDKTITVRVALPGEKLATLDGEVRTLTSSMLAITDSSGPIGLAGVIGGTNSEIKPGTTSILLESANFNQINIRRTSNTLRLNTEASYRFERGIRSELADRALRRALHLILQIAGGEIAQGIIDLYPGHEPSPVVKIRRSRVKQVLGIDLSLPNIETTLKKLCFEKAIPPEGTPKNEVTDTLWIRIPYWRTDIKIEDDLVEELARLIGYDAIPTSMLSSPIPHRISQDIQLLKDRIKDHLASSGMQEIISYPLTNLGVLSKVEALNIYPDPIKISNPMSSEMSVMRTSMRGSMLQSLATNYHISSTEGIKLFEIGRIYLPKTTKGGSDLPHEKETLIGLLHGPRLPVSWLSNQSNMDFFDAKGILQSLFEVLNIHIEYESSKDPILHPGKTAKLKHNDIYMGVIGEVHPSILERFDLAINSVAIFEIDLESLCKIFSPNVQRYRSFSRFPESHRDLALIVDEAIASGKIQNSIKTHELVTHVTLFDVYSGKELPTGKKSLAFRVTLKSPSGTLTSEEIDQTITKILAHIRKDVDVELRV